MNEFIVKQNKRLIQDPKVVFLNVCIEASTIFNIID